MASGPRKLVLERQNLRVYSPQHKDPIFLRISRRYSFSASMLVLPGRGKYMLAQRNSFQHGPSRYASKDSDYMFATTEPAPGEKLKFGSFRSKLFSKFIDICDKVRDMRLYIATYFPEALSFRNPKYRHGSIIPGCGCIPKVSL